MTEAQHRTPAEMNKHAKDLTFRAELAIHEEEPIEAAYLFLRADMWYTTAQTCARMDKIITKTELAHEAPEEET